MHRASRVYTITTSSPTNVRIDLGRPESTSGASGARLAVFQVILETTVPSSDDSTRRPKTREAF